MNEELIARLRQAKATAQEDYYSACDPDLIGEAADALEGAQPAPQVPMTDEEIDILYFPYSYLTLRKAFITGIRIAEAHHKIGV